MSPTRRQHHWLYCSHVRPEIRACDRPTPHSCTEELRIQMTQHGFTAMQIAWNNVGRTCSMRTQWHSRTRHRHKNRPRRRRRRRHTITAGHRRRRRHRHTVAEGHRHRHRHTIATGQGHTCTPSSRCLCNFPQVPAPQHNHVKMLKKILKRKMNVINL